MKPIAESRQTKICLHVSCKKRKDVLLPLLFNFALECAFRKVQVDQKGLKLIGTHQLLFYNDGFIVLGASICIVKEYTEASVLISNEICLELNDKKTKYMITSQDQHAVQNHTIYIGNKSFERVEHFKYLGTSLTIQNSILEEIKCRLQSGNACYYLLQNILSSSLLSKKLKIKIYRTIILPVVCMGVKLGR